MKTAGPQRGRLQGRESQLLASVRQPLGSSDVTVPAPTPRSSGSGDHVRAQAPCRGARELQWAGRVPSSGCLSPRSAHPTWSRHLLRSQRRCQRRLDDGRVTAWTLPTAPPAVARVSPSLSESVWNMQSGLEGRDSQGTSCSRGCGVQGVLENVENVVPAAPLRPSRRPGRRGSSILLHTDRRPWAGPVTLPPEPQSSLYLHGAPALPGPAASSLQRVRGALSRSQSSVICQLPARCQSPVPEYVS